MIKNPIGILDSGFEGLTVVEKMTKGLKNEDIIYINDCENYPYEGKATADIVSYVQKNVEFLLTQNIKLLVVVSDVIVEYCSDYLSTLSIPVLNSVNAIIDYVHNKYEQKNLALFARNDILESNIYQKNFKYNRLYNIPSDDIEALINQNEIKTSASFAAINEATKVINKRSVDVIIPSSPFLIKLKTEFTEYLEYTEIIDIGSIICRKIEEMELPLYDKKKGNLYCYSILQKAEFVKRSKWLDAKYKYIKIKKSEKDVN